MPQSPTQEREGWQRGYPILRQIENTMPNNITLRGVEGIHRVFMMERPRTTLLRNPGFSRGKSGSGLNGQCETLQTTHINVHPETGMGSSTHDDGGSVAAPLECG